MKRLILILVCVVAVLSMYAQCDNGVSTDPGNPTNNSLPDVGSASNNPDSRYLNGFDWWTPSDYTLTNMEYNASQPYTYMSNIQSSGVLPAYSYLNKSLGAEEMNPQNGWELLLVNLGRYPDDITVHTFQTFKSVPYIVLYNRYRGLIRVFVRYGNNEPPNNAVDGVKINLYYKTQNNPENLSGLLRSGQSVQRSLDQPTEVKALSAIAEPNGLANFWLSADFQIAYDPCVCHYPTSLSLDFEYFSETDFKLNGRGITLNSELMVDANGAIVAKDFLNGVDFSDGTNASGGYVIYKTMQDLADDYEANLLAYKQRKIDVNAYNNEVERKLAVIAAYKKVVEVGLALYGVSSVADFWKSIYPDLGFDETAETKPLRDKFFEEVKSMLGNRVDNYYAENLTKKENPEAPSMPTATFSEMSFSGQLYNSQPINGPLFSTPGSFINNPAQNDQTVDEEVYGYPVYNQPLGVFALLEKPEFLMYDEGYNLSFENGYNPNDPNEPWIFYKQANKKQFKLNSDLKYAFNEALDIESYDISVSMGYRGELTDDSWAMTEVGNLIDPISGTVKGYDQSVNVSSDSLLANPNLGPYLFEDGSKITYYTPFIPIEAAKSYVYEINTMTECALYSVSSGASSAVQNGDNLLHGWDYSNDEVYMKLKIDVRFSGVNDQGEPRDYTLIETYKFDVGTISSTSSELHPNLGGSFDDLSNYSKNLYFSDTYFNGSAITGCNLNGSAYTCQCWNDITIDGNITVANGYTVNMLAGNEIEVINNSQIDPEVVLDIVPILDYSNPMPPSSSTYVSNFCQGLNPNAPAYQANLTKDHFNGVNDEETETLPIDQPEYLAFNLYPNPTSSSVAIGFVCSTGEDLHISLLDMTGKTLSTKQISAAYLTEGINVNELDLMGLSSGYYFVVLKSGNLTKTEKLVIQK